MFTDPYAKLCLTTLMASEFEKTIYFDLDTTFTAYFRAGLIRPAKDNLIDIYVPSEGRLLPLVKDVLESMQSSSLVIFDSVNSFYNMFNVREKTLGGLNHLLSILVMLLVRRGVDSGIPVLATTMFRYRHAGGWVESPASRRLLQNKSAVRMKVEKKDDDSLSLNIVDHGSIPAGTEILYKNTAVTIA